MAYFGRHLPEQRKPTETVSTAGNTADIRIQYYFPKSIQIRSAQYPHIHMRYFRLCVAYCIQTPVVAEIQTALFIKVINSNDMGTCSPWMMTELSTDEETD